VARFAPPFAGIASGTTPPPVQQAFALRIEVEEAQHAAALRFAQRLIAADEFIVRHASICEHDRSPRADAHLAAKR